MGCVQCPISNNYEFNDFKVCIYKSRYPLITNRAKITFNDIAVSVLTHYLETYQYHPMISVSNILDARQLPRLVWMVLNGYFS